MATMFSFSFLNKVLHYCNGQSLLAQSTFFFCGYRALGGGKGSAPPPTVFVWKQTDISLILQGVNFSFRRKFDLAMCIQG
jgi:hypothetical protein